MSSFVCYVRSHRNSLAQVCYLMILAQLIWQWLAKHQISAQLAHSWLLLQCLIQPGHNLIVLSLWNLKAFLLARQVSSVESFYFFYIISNACHFTLGNSNSLSTIPIQSGFVGVNEMSELTVAALLLSATFASTVYWFLLRPKWTGGFILMEATVVLVYTTSSFLQKEHLFVWSVFAPKLIYLLFSVVLKLALLILTINRI
jgi:ethanolaminephosphotransferase